MPSGPEESERFLDVVELYADELDGGASFARPRTPRDPEFGPQQRRANWIVVAVALGLMAGAFMAGRAWPAHAPLASAHLASPSASAVNLASSPQTNSICDRPAYELTVIARAGTEDAMAAVAAYFPGFVLQSAHRFVYADTLKLCRVELTASDKSGVSLRLQAHTGPDNAYDEMANRILTGQHVIVLSHMSDDGFVVSIEIAGPAAAKLPPVAQLERFVADPVLAA
ncbi:hypothetical protein SAMN05444157_0094 [Frankineae bacterium MT45]|nr:hypothetical protein SAMN05444157_0094 [Frankineae bacterium MT45]